MGKQNKKTFHHQIDDIAKIMKLRDEAIVRVEETQKKLSNNKKNNIDLPKPPKHFGTWLNMYKSLELKPETLRIAYFDESFDSFNGIEPKTIEVSLLAQYVMQECSETTAKIIKLNEDLSTENDRLLTELEVANDRVSHFKHWNDGYKKQIKEGVESWAKEVDAKTDLEKELTSIKSKWWYKLMT